MINLLKCGEIWKARIKWIEESKGFLQALVARNRRGQKIKLKRDLQGYFLRIGGRLNWLRILSSGRFWYNWLLSKC